MQISYIGMQTQEVIIKPTLKVILKADAQKLDEIVVTAMGISREKKALGYAVQDVKSDVLTRAANTDLAGALQGKVSGIDITPSSGMPGASSKITIRGSRSFTGDNTPLYVIDGMPIASTADVSTSLTDGAYGTDYANRAVDIDPNDIESINILKGQAASALYGMRASNGVIVITTKSGKGANKGKPNITFSTNLSFDKISTLPELQQEYAQGSKGVFDPLSPFAWGPRISELPNDPNYGGNTNNSYTNKYGKQPDRYYVPQLAAAGMDPWATPKAYNNMKDFFETGVSWSNNVNVAQKFDKGNYSFSMGNTTTNGIVPSTGMDRYNVKLSAEAQLHPNWTTGFNGNFVTSKITKQSTANTSVVATVYNAPVSYNMAGDYTQSYYYTPAYGGGFYMGNPIVYPIAGAMAYVPYYKVYDPNLKPQNTKSYEIGADLTFFNGLVTLNYTYSRQNVKDQIFEVPLAGSTGASSMIMNGGKIHTNTHEVTLGISPVDTKNFKLDFAFNFSKIDNYVDELAPGVESIMLRGFVTPQVRAGIGDKFPVIYGKSYMRNNEGKIVVDQNGLPMQGEDAVIGTVSPDFRLGFNTNIELYKFRISAVFDWKQGGQMYSGTAGEMNYYGVSKLSGDMRKTDFIVENSVKETGKDTNGNPIYAPNDIKVSDAQSYFTRRRSIDESYIYDNSYIKLRELSISYPVLSKKWLNVNVNVFARNILVWSEFKGFDPEASQGNDNMGGAFERFSLPGTASYGFGFNVKF